MMCDVIMSTFCDLYMCQWESNYY